MSCQAHVAHFSLCPRPMFTLSSLYYAYFAMNAMVSPSVGFLLCVSFAGLVYSCSFVLRAEVFS